MAEETKMEAADGVKEELAAMQLGGSEDVDMENAEATAVTLDKVSLLQDSVDKMALSMFNALRLLPANAGDDATKEETKDTTDALIDDLPGLDKTERRMIDNMVLIGHKEASKIDDWLEKGSSVSCKLEKKKKANGRGGEQDMADLHGGRVLAGEDSEEDEDEEEEYSFQFNSFGSQQQSPAAPRFAVPTVIAPPDGAESAEEDSEGEEQKQEDKQPATEPKGEAAVEATDASEVAGEAEDNGDGLAMARSKDMPQETAESPEGGDEELWEVDGSVNGIEIMSDAFIDTIRPSLDATIHRIAELKENQQRLLRLLTQQNDALLANKQLDDVVMVLEKLPHYVKKVQAIKLAMAEISTSTEKMKHRAENLRIDAQSHAIKKENKRDAQSQWNKLYAAKSAPGPSSTSS
ncbi:hypothetical protein BBJ28_00025781 [Nothophytophthora sp. Chile5]|nr:hypothetical protein BBJ28_00025781 [Nothophytophthora sp. Chile5]